MTLRAYQVLARDHALRVPRSAIFIPMGGGKGYAALSVVEARMLADVDKVLVVSTLRIARSVWPEECAKWTPHLSIEFMGGEPARGAKGITSAEWRAQRLRQSKAQIHTINFDLVPWFVSQFQDRPFDYQMIIVDESSKLRGYRTKQGTARSAALMEVAFKARYFMELTGLPAPNGLDQLWGQMFFLDRGIRLGKSFEAFKQRWFQAVPNGDSGYSQIRPLAHAQNEITELIRPLCLSIDLAQYMDLKEPVVNDIYVDLPPDIFKKYKAMEKTFYTEIADKPIEAVSAAAKSAKLLQLSNGSVITDSSTGEWVHVHDSKMDALESVFEEAGGAPVLVVYQYVADLARILGRFLFARVLNSNQDIKDFQEGKIAAGVLHGLSGGHGLNLAQNCNIMAMVGLTWDLETYAQVIERIGPARQASLGTNKVVTIHRILARNTIDTVVAQRLATKRSVQDCLMAAMQKETS